MSDFLNSAFFKKATGQVDPEEVEEKEVEEKEVEEIKPTEVADDEVKSQEDPEKKTPADELVKTDEAKEEKVERVSVADAHKKWADEQDEALTNFYKEKATDYKSLPAEKLILKGLSEDYPEMSTEELTQMMYDEYGEPSVKIEITDLMEDDEIKEAEKHNKEIDKRSRKLKADATKLSSKFEERKSSLERPEFTADVSEPDGVEKFTKEEYESSLDEQVQANMQNWKALVDISVKPLEKFEYKGLEVPLTKEDNEALKDAVLNYVAQPGDVESFADGKGSVDMSKFVPHVAKTILLDRLIEAAQKAGSAEGADDKKKEIQRTLVNYQDPNKSEVSSENEVSVKSATKSAWKTMSGN